MAPPMVRESLRTVLDYARAYQGLGYAVIPVPLRTKKPILDGWQKLRLTEAELPRHFRGNVNIGILTGEPSGWLADVDCDAPEAISIAMDLLPRTPMIHGHGISGKRSKPRSHFWYRSRVATRKYQFNARDQNNPVARLKEQTMLVELRSTGGQTIVPPSLHPSGEAISWENARGCDGDFEGIEPAEVAAQDLERAVAKVAAAALLALHWPGKGSRDDAAMALAGMLARGGWNADEIDEFAKTTAHAAGDEQWQGRGKGRGAGQKLAEGRTITGAPKLAELLFDGEYVVTKVREWLGLKQPAEQPKMRNDAKGAQSENRAAMGIFNEVGQLWKGIIRLSEVTPEQVRWLWQGRIPLGKLTIIDGNPDLGKSILFGADLPARVTKAEAMPDGTPGLSEPAGVVLLSAEDDVADTIRPRLDAAGANAHKVVAIQSVPRLKEDGSLDEASFFIPRDLPWLKQVIEHASARYVLIDPLMAYLHPSEVNSYRDQDVRTALAPLSRLAAETGAAIVAIRHLNKSSAANPLYRGGGSIGISAAARSVLLVAEDPDDETKQRRILARSKGNLAASVPALAYHIAVTDAGVPFIVWEGQTAHTAAQLLASPVDGEARTETDEAVEWLRSVLEETGGQMPSRDVQAKAKQEGISEKVLRSARQRICEKPTREGFGADGAWQWRLARTSPPLPKMLKDAHVSGQGAYGGEGHLCSMTGGSHEYAQLRTADGRRICVKCDQPEEQRQVSA